MWSLKEIASRFSQKVVKSFHPGGSGSGTGPKTISPLVTRGDLTSTSKAQSPRCGEFRLLAMLIASSWKPSLNTKPVLGALVQNLLLSSERAAGEVSSSGGRGNGITGDRRPPGRQGRTRGILGDSGCPRGGDTGCWRRPRVGEGVLQGEGVRERNAETTHDKSWVWQMGGDFLGWQRNHI